MKKKRKPDPDLKKLMDQATAYGAMKNREFAAKGRGKVLMIKIDPDNDRANITICFTGHKNFNQMKYRSDIVVNLSENTILKNRFKSSIAKPPAEPSKFLNDYMNTTPGLT